MGMKNIRKFLTVQPMVFELSVILFVVAIPTVSVLYLNAKQKTVYVEKEKIVYVEKEKPEKKNPDDCLCKDDNPEAFDFWYNHMTKWEGGYSNNPNDLGGETNKGITWNTYKLLADKVGAKKTKWSFHNLDKETHKKFAKYFWDFSRANKSNKFAISIIMAEELWGEGGMKNFVKYTNEFFAEDFKYIDDATQYLNGVGCDDVRKFTMYLQAKRAFYYTNRSTQVVKGKRQSVFLAGWMNRISDLNMKFTKL